MAAFDALTVGQVVHGPPYPLTEDAISSLVRLTGFTHPLFTDAAFARASPLGGTPLPGQLVLAVMGGLAERTEVFDASVVALVAIDEARFETPALAGDTLHLELRVADKRPSPGGSSGTITVAGRCTNQRGETVATAVSTLLVRR